MSFVARRAANARRAEAQNITAQPTQFVYYKIAGGEEDDPHLPPGRRGPFVPAQPGGTLPGIDPRTGLPTLGDPGAGVPPESRPHKNVGGSGHRTSSRAAAPSSTRQATGGALPDGIAHDLGTALGKVLGPVVAQHFMNQANEALHGQLRAQGIVQ